MCFALVRELYSWRIVSLLFNQGWEWKRPTEDYEPIL